MKKICIFFLLSIIISVTALGFSGVFAAETGNDADDYLRIHIRADGNDAASQGVKYAVKEAVVDYLTPVVAHCTDKQSAVESIRSRLIEIADVATRTLRNNGFSYGASARIADEEFPTRVYDGYTLPQGVYTALIIELGSGKGDNWWCVVYPPLCFASPNGNNVAYKSKIAEIIENWKKK